METLEKLGMSLWEAVEQGAGGGSRLTILGKGDIRTTWSSEQLLEEAERCAAGLVAHGLKPGDRVGLVASTTFDFIMGCLAAWRFGGTVASLPPAPRLASREEWARQTQRRLEKVSAAAVLTSPNQPVVETSFPTIDLFNIQTSAPVGYPAPGPQDAALIQFTSGSTSDPKGVVMTHGAVTRQLASWDRLVGPSGGQPVNEVMSWLPLYHDLGFIQFLWWPLMTGASLNLLPPHLFMRNVSRWFTEMARLETTHTAAPNFAYGLGALRLKTGLEHPVDLSCLRVAGCGGEAIDYTTIESFYEAAEHCGLAPSSFLPGYGMAEATCAVTATHVGEGMTVDHVDRDVLARGRAEPAGPSSRTGSFVTVGGPLPGVKLKIDGNERDEDRVVGEVLIRCPFLMEGYLDDPEATAAVLTSDGWLRSGDLGYMVDDHLYIAGRIKDVIIVNGYNFYAEDLERVASKADGVRKGNCVAFAVKEGDTEGVVLMVETRLGGEVEQEQLRSEVAGLMVKEAGLAPSEVVLVPPRTIPKTSSGKLQRSVLRRSYEASATETETS